MHGKNAQFQTHTHTLTRANTNAHAQKTYSQTIRKHIHTQQKLYKQTHLNNFHILKIQTYTKSTTPHIMRPHTNKQT